MKQFEIRTPALKDVTDAFLNVISGRRDGTLEHDEARDIVAAGNGVVRAVGQELKVRLAMPRIAAAEARVVDAALPDVGDDTKAIETPSVRGRSGRRK